MKAVLIKGHRLRDEFSCPVTRELMRDPVIAADGHTYDREAIEMWLRNHDTSPKTGQPMDHLFLVPNHNLKRLIKDLLTEGGEGLYVRDEGEDYGRYRYALVTEQVLILKCLGPLESDWNGKSFRVTQRGCIGGRKQPAQLNGGDFMHFSDATVSRKHLEISFNADEKRFSLRDLGSAGGTFVRVPFGVPKPLAPGMMIMLGKHQLMISSCENDDDDEDSGSRAAPLEAPSKEGSPMGTKFGPPRVSKRLIDELSGMSLRTGQGALPGDDRTIRGVGANRIAEGAGSASGGEGSAVDGAPGSSGVAGGGGGAFAVAATGEEGDKSLFDGDGAEDAASVSDMPRSDAEDKAMERAVAAASSSSTGPGKQAGSAPGSGGGGNGGNGSGLGSGGEDSEASAKSLADAFRAEAKLARGHRQLALRCFAPEGTPIQEREYVVGPEGATLGRKQTNTVAFSHDVGGQVMGIDSSISGEHARIEYDADNDCLQIWDGTAGKPSTNGTWFRLSAMHRESEPYAVQDGAEILAGTVRFAASIETMVVEKEIAEGEDVEKYLKGGKGDFKEERDRSAKRRGGERP